MKAKYIVIEIFGLESMIVFPPCVKHSDVAASIPGTTLSAGFIKDGCCYGHSESLEKDSRGKMDGELLADLQTMCGMEL